MHRDIGNLFPELSKDLEAYTAQFTTGILPFQDIARLIEGGRIQAREAIEDSQLQPASLDLRLGAKACGSGPVFCPAKILQSALKSGN